MIYVLRDLDVDCTSIDKSPKHHEFGAKVSLATTSYKGFAVGMRIMPKDSYDGPTLPEALEQVEILSDHMSLLIFVDRGIRARGFGTKVLTSGARRARGQAAKCCSNAAAPFN